MKSLQNYADYLPQEYSNYPRGYYVSVILIRKVEGEAIFRTEGSGEPLNREYVHAGIEDNSPVIPRVVISKRKQTAVERRTGRELLRRLGLLDATAGLNEGQPEPDSIDSMIYGYAVGGGGAQKSRVITDDAFSILPATQVVGKRQFNAPFEDGTMRHPETGKPSTSIGTDEYVRPETHFLDIETLKDMTAGEVTYVLGNILRSSRYGAISSRTGKITNTLAAVVFSDTELFSNLELTQAVWQRLRDEMGQDPDHPLADTTVLNIVQAAAEQLKDRVIGRVVFMTEADLVVLRDELQELYTEEKEVRLALDNVQTDYKR